MTLAVITLLTITPSYLITEKIVMPLAERFF